MATTRWSIQTEIENNGLDNFCPLALRDNNLGFKLAHNVSVALTLTTTAPPDHVLLLEPDTMVRPSALRALLDLMNRTKAGPTLFWPRARWPNEAADGGSMS